MTFKSTIWYPIAAVVSVANLVAVGFVPGPEPWHATIHAGLALGFGLWAQRLRQSRSRSELPTPLEELDIEVSRLRQELNEAQERLDFTERLLTQRAETSRERPEL